MICVAGVFSANMAMAGAGRGVVNDSLIGLNLSDSPVTIEGKDDVSDVKRESTSRTDGRFSFGNLPPGTYTLRASYIGYPDLRETVVYLDPKDVGALERLSGRRCPKVFF